MRNRLKYLRDLNGLSIKQFADKAGLKETTIANYISGSADKAGLKETTIANYISGSSVPSLANTEQIAKAFDVSPTWLAGWPEPKERIVYVKAERIPPDWKNNECGKLIRWTKRGQKKELST